MSALYGLALIGAWLSLTAWFWKVWRRRRAQPDANRRTVDAAGILFLLLWVGASFWYGGGRMYYYDMQVNRMCAIDGGVKLYEAVKLPVEEYDQYAKRNWIFPDRAQEKSADKYYYEVEYHHFREGAPQMTRRHAKIIRRSDGKTLGESISYSRGGGDLPGPWHPSTLICPPISKDNPGLEVSIFQRGDEK
ncbi:MAG: hypothetical protein KDD77_01715 [Caldilineaceae bacterium]|nr:hypothetical protein [Rhodocyclaceae bacterium]MCB0065834.1 hypothetical protein [Caldilineaceae bacterium]